MRPVRAVLFALVKPDPERGDLILMERCAKKAARHGGEWFIPGGKAEPGDRNSVATMHREMYEELRCVAVPGAFASLGLYDLHGGAHVVTPVHAFVVEGWVGWIPPHVYDRRENVLQWFPLTEAARSPVPLIRDVARAIGARSAAAMP